MSSLRTLSTVNEQYRTRFQRYAAALSDLTAAGYIDQVLGTGTKGGYTFDYRGRTATWSCAADPSSPGGTSTRHFFVDQTGVIRFSTLGTAGSTDTPIE